MALEFLGIDFSSRRELHRDPPWTAARQAIELLDGESVAMVRLGTAAGTSLSIGGGKDGRYVVSGVHSNGSATCLVDQTNVGPPVSIQNGRAPAVFPSRLVVSKAHVLRAAESFWRDGRFDHGLSWQPG